MTVVVKLQACRIIQDEEKVQSDITWLPFILGDSRRCL